MRRRFIVLSLISSLVLVVAGVAALSWVFVGQERERQRLQEQQERFDARLHELDRVVAGEIDVRSFATALPGENQQYKADNRRAATEKREFVLGVAGVCIFVGGAIAGSWLLLWTARLLIKGLSYLPWFSARNLTSRRVTKDKRGGQANTAEDEKGAKRRQEQCEQPERPQKHSRMLANSGWHNSKPNLANQFEPASLDNVLSLRTRPHFNDSAQEAEKLAVMLSNGESSGPETVTGGFNVNTAQSGRLCNTVQKTDPVDSQDSFPELEGLLRTQSENLEKQTKEFKQMAKSVQRTTLEHSEPLKSNLKELIQQVSAIREYALQQQGRMEKLQDGYDWNIIRTFCLRVIRCIDNLETRIARLSKEDIETTDLEQVRDEMMFALESSGVERFEPEIDSDYRGQERKAEAVKGRKRTDDRNLMGKIAKVVRPGYQYVIDDENVKVVRTARVKLFG